MNLVKSTLGINKKIEKPTTAVVSYSGGSNIPYLQPVIVCGNILEGSTENSNIDVSTFFPISSKNSARAVFQIPVSGVIKTEEKRLIENRAIKVVELFDYSRLSKIEKFVSENGALTIIMEDPTVAVSFIKDIDIIRSFSENIVDFGYSLIGDSSSIINGNPITYINFYDLKLSIPVFYRDKVKGFAVSVGVFCKNESEENQTVKPIMEVHFAVNKFPENLLTVEQTKIRTANGFNKPALAHLAEKLKERAKKSEKSKKEKAKPSEKIESELMNNWQDYIYFDSVSARTTSSTSSNTKYIF